VSRRTENGAYETTRSVKHVKTPQGAIKRISASLLIDNEVQWQGKGKAMKRVLVPPTPEKLKAIHDIVAGVLGIVPDRGDQLVIESLPFEQTVAADQPPESAAPPASAPATPINALLKDKRVLIGAGVGAFLLVGAVVFLLFRGKKKKSVTVEATTAGALEAGHPSASALSSAVASNALPGSASRSDESLSPELPPLNKKVEVLREHIKDQVRKDPIMLANVLRNWLEEEAK
jgi:flagellar M-ring protein FliF